MRALIALFLIPLFFGAVSCKTDFPNEFIVTSEDLPHGVYLHLGEPGKKYRLYGLAADYTYGIDLPNVARITIVDSEGTTFKLTDLRDPYLNSAFLNDTNIVVSPVTANDPNPLKPGSEGLPTSTRLPFVLYLVSVDVPAMPVVDAVTAYKNGGVHYDGPEVQGLTILCANAYFSLMQFEITTTALIIPRGYDYSNNGGSAGSMLDINQNNAKNSRISIIGPIATIFNAETKSGRYKFVYTDAPLDQVTQTDSSITITSPNWVSLNDSYLTSWIDYKFAFDEQFNYVNDRHLEFSLSASHLFNDANITIEVNSDNGKKKQWSYLSTTNGEMRDTIYGSFIRMIVAVDYRVDPKSYPRFILKVTSGAFTNSTMTSLLLVFYYLML